MMKKEQKGCCGGSKGYKDRLLISKTVLQEYKRKKKLCLAWIAYQKAFDMLPHSWIIKSLEISGINNKAVSFTKNVMSYCGTRMHLHTENKTIETEDIKIQRRIFQECSLFPLIFCIYLIPLTEHLNRLNTQYEEHTKKTKISHLLFMDDSKLIAKSEEEFQKEIQTVKIFSDDIHMEFGL